MVVGKLPKILNSTRAIVVPYMEMKRSTNSGLLDAFKSPLTYGTAVLVAGVGIILTRFSVPIAAVDQAAGKVEVSVVSLPAQISMNEDGTADVPSSVGGHTSAGLKFIKYTSPSNSTYTPPLALVMDADGTLREVPLDQALSGVYEGSPINSQPAPSLPSLTPGRFPEEVKLALENWDGPGALEVLDLQRQVATQVRTETGNAIEPHLRVAVALDLSAAGLDHSVSCVAGLCELQVVVSKGDGAAASYDMTVDEMVRKATTTYLPLFKDYYRPQRNLQIDVPSGKFLVWYWAERKR